MSNEENASEPSANDRMPSGAPIKRVLSLHIGVDDTLLFQCVNKADPGAKVDAEVLKSDCLRGADYLNKLLLQGLISASVRHGIEVGEIERMVRGKMR